MKEIRNIIFDFDGTLADTSKLIVATMQQSIKDYGLPYRNEDEIKATIGVRLEEIPSILWPDIEGIGNPLAAIYRENFEKLKDKIPVTLFLGVKETLSFLQDNGYSMAIATSRNHSSVVDLTERLGIKKHFDYLLGGDNVSKGKPNPESIMKILNEMDWNSDETLMVGDMSVDILMGKNADVLTCGVTYGNCKESELKEVAVDYIIPEFPDLTKIIIPEEDAFEEEISLRHINSAECQCAECRKEKSKYVQIVDEDRFVDNLNDWD